MKHVNKAEKEMIGVNNISEQNWLKCYKISVSHKWNKYHLLGKKYVFIYPVILEEFNEMLSAF